jgi:type IV secretion system protein VirB2
MKLGLCLPAPHRPRCATLVFTALVFAQLVAVAQAATSTGMPWDQPLNQILSALTGSIAHVIGVVAIFALGCAMAFSEGGSVLRKALWVALGLTLAFNAGTWGLQFLGLGSGLCV